jgi:hypothetical protein
MPEDVTFPSVSHNCLGAVKVSLHDSSSLEREESSSPTKAEVLSRGTFQVA